MHVLSELVSRQLLAPFRNASERSEAVFHDAHAPVAGRKVLICADAPEMNEEFLQEIVPIQVRLEAPAQRLAMPDHLLRLAHNLVKVTCENLIINVKLLSLSAEEVILPAPM